MTAPKGQRAISDRERELMEMPSIESQMPINFKIGSMFTEVNGYCAKCEKLVDAGLLRGVIHRPFENVAVVEAVCACLSCRLLTPLNLRLHDDMRLTGLRDGKWVTWKGSPSLWDKARGYLERWLSKT